MMHSLFCIMFISNFRIGRVTDNIGGVSKYEELQD